MSISKKNIALVFAVIVVLIAIVLSVIGNSRKKETLKQEEPDKTVIPSLPENQIANSPDLSRVKQNIQEEIEKTQKEMTTLSEKKYQNDLGQIVSVDDFSKASEIKIEKDVRRSSSQTDYLVFSCFKEKKERSSVGIMLQQRRDVDPQQYQNLFSEMEKYMGKWENTIFNDLSPLFFPGESFDAKPVFSGTEYITSNKVNIIEVRFSNLTAVSGKNYSIDWGFLGDQVFMSNDKSCLRKMLDKNADAYEP